jgi:hypothetical protein
MEDCLDLDASRHLVYVTRQSPKATNYENNIFRTAMISSLLLQSSSLTRHHGRCRGRAARGIFASGLELHLAPADARRRALEAIPSSPKHAGG